MFDVHKPKQEPVVVIRAASAAELSNYEKRKLANIEENAQENKIESISLNIAGQTQQLPTVNKAVKIDLGKLAVKTEVGPDDLSGELFFIKCELDDTILNSTN